MKHSSNETTPFLYCISYYSNSVTQARESILYFRAPCLRDMQRCLQLWALYEACSNLKIYILKGCEVPNNWFSTVRDAVFESGTTASVVWSATEPPHLQQLNQSRKYQPQLSLEQLHQEICSIFCDFEKGHSAANQLIS